MANDELTGTQRRVLSILEDHPPMNVRAIRRHLEPVLDGSPDPPHPRTIRRALHALIDAGHDVVWFDGMVYLEPPWAIRTAAAEQLHAEMRRLRGQLAQVYGGRCAYRKCRNELDPKQRASLTLYCTTRHRFLEARERDKE